MGRIITPVIGDVRVLRFQDKVEVGGILLHQGEVAAVWRRGAKSCTRYCKFIKGPVARFWRASGLCA
jgi:hypothetical protein